MTSFRFPALTEAQKRLCPPLVRTLPMSIGKAKSRRTNQASGTKQLKTEAAETHEPSFGH